MELQGSKFISIQQLVYTQFSYLFSKHVVYIYVIIYIFYLWLISTSMPLIMTCLELNVVGKTVLADRFPKLMKSLWSHFMKD